MSEIFRSTACPVSAKISNIPARPQFFECVAVAASGKNRKVTQVTAMSTPSQPILPVTSENYDDHANHDEQQISPSEDSDGANTDYPSTPTGDQDSAIHPDRETDKRDPLPLQMGVPLPAWSPIMHGAEEPGNGSAFFVIA